VQRPLRRTGTIYMLETRWVPVLQRIISLRSCCGLRPGHAAHASSIPRHHAPEFCLQLRPSKKQRAQGKPGARCTHSLACKMKKHTSVVTTGSPEKPGLPCAMVLTVSFALSLVTGLICHHRQRKISSANLTPASGRQDHTTSPSAKTPSSAQRLRSPLLRPPHPIPHVRDDREPPLFWGWDPFDLPLLLPIREAEYFWKGGWTAP